MKPRTIALLKVMMAGAVVSLVGCGGDDSTTPAPTDAGKDQSTPPVDGGGTDSGNPDGGNTAKILPGPSHGSAVTISPDDSVAVVTNRDVGTVTVLKLTYPGGGAPATATVAGEVTVGAEPWQAVISPDSTTAYVVVRKDQKVVKITGLQGTPAAGASVAVGSEPTGIAMTPTGAKVWVTNWVDGTLSGIDTATMTVGSTVDLNAALVATGYLGAGAKARPALAHPRSIAITNNLDNSDTDESIYATEYYAQGTAPEALDGANSDTRKSGIVYRVKISDKSVKAIALAPLADMGFKDEKGVAAGCYPNQLQSVTINGKFAYVVSVCASPKGPTGPRVTATPCTAATIAADCPTGTAPTGFVDPVCVLTSALAANPVCVDVASVKTTTAPLVSVIDTTTEAEVAGASASLNAKFRDFYVTKAVADNGTRRYPLLASDMAFVAGSSIGYVSANGADAVFRVRYDATTGAIAEVGAANANFLDLNPAGIAAPKAGLNPIGLAIGSKGFAVVASERTRVATILDLNTQGVAGGPATPSTAQLTAPPGAGTPEAAVLAGKRFFNTGMGRWSLKGQGWGACQSCHVDGLTDNVTWYFARGPRQSTSLDGTFNKADLTDQRILNWSGINDEFADFEGNTRGISGGLGAVVSANSTPPTTADRIDITTPCAAPPCTNGQGNIGLNGSALKASDPANTLSPQLTAPGVLTDWANITKYAQTIRSPRGATGLDATKVAAGLALFTTDAGCAGCHSGGKWTISKTFVDPQPAAMAALKTTQWPALNGFPPINLPAKTVSVMRFAGPDPNKAGAFDQLLCMMRPVGTFGVAETAAGIAELRIDMSTPAQGKGDANGDGAGYNPPSLLGLQTGAPYFHAGNALTLEAAFGTLFATHHQSFAPNFLSTPDAAKVDQLVSFLLSIDASTTSVAIPAVGPKGGNFCTP